MQDFLIVIGAVLVFISLVFAVAMYLKRLDVVDIAWGGAFIVAALTSFFIGGEQGGAQTLVTGLVIIWGLRLGLSILRRFYGSKKEDERYTELRKQWKGNLYLNAYIRIFLIQGVLAIAVSLSVIVMNLSEPRSVGVLALIGLIIWSIGFYYESVGDEQLRRHLANPANKGKLMTSGLWRYTRHPNYFGESVQWWGIWIIALAVPWGWATIVAPLTITILLLFVSGVALTEKRFEGRHGWSEYKRSTSVFIPLPPKHS